MRKLALLSTVAIAPLLYSHAAMAYGCPGVNNPLRTLLEQAGPTIPFDCTTGQANLSAGLQAIINSAEQVTHKDAPNGYIGANPAGKLFPSKIDPVGSSVGQALMSNGPSGTPTWQTPPSAATAYTAAMPLVLNGTVLQVTVGAGGVVLDNDMRLAKANTATQPTDLASAIGQITPASIGAASPGSVATAIGNITPASIGAASPASVATAIGAITPASIAAATAVNLTAEIGNRQSAISGITAGSIGAELAANKNIANGYLGLNSSAKVAIGEIDPGVSSAGMVFTSNGPGSPVTWQQPSAQTAGITSTLPLSISGGVLSLATGNSTGGVALYSDPRLAQAGTAIQQAGLTSAIAGVTPLSIGAPTASAFTTLNSAVTNGLPGQDLSPSMTSSATGMPRSQTARASDIIRPEDYGATHSGALVPIGTRYGSTLAQVAGYSVANGSHPFAFMLDKRFGVTFDMTPSVASAAAAQTFLMDHIGINGLHAQVAIWQDPAHGVDLVAVGMDVTGACITGTATVTAVGRTPGLSGSADATYGHVTISPAPSSPCATTAPLTFSMSAGQVQALSIDWLGWQAAMAQSYFSPTGGDVHGQRGMYVLNHSLVNPGGILDTVNQFPNIELVGAGIAETVLSFPTDLGLDMGAIVESNAAQGAVNASHYHEFTLRGPGNGNVNGTGATVDGVPVGMDGLRIGHGAVARNLIINAFRAGVSGINDHWELHTVISGSNTCGVEYRAYTYTMGNQIFEDGSLGGNANGSVCVSTTNQMDSSLIKNVHFGFGPRAFYYEPNTANVIQTLGGIVTGTTFIDAWLEALGYCFICSNEHVGGVGGNTFIGGAGESASWSTDPRFTIPDGAGGHIQMPAMIDVGDFSYNTMIHTAWAPYAEVASDAIIQSSGACSSNNWIEDHDFVFGASPAVSQFHCLVGGVDGNSFSGSFGFGSFKIAQYWSLTQYEALTQYSYGGIGPFDEGYSFAGLATSAVTNGQYRSVGVLKSAPRVPVAGQSSASGVPKTNVAQGIGSQQPVFAENGGGVSGGISQAHAIGSTLAQSDPGNNAVQIQLDPGAANGAPGSSSNQTAAGATQATAFTITTGEINQFTTVAAGANGVMLGIIPVGTSEVICNDGAVAMAVYPPLVPANSNFQGSAAGASAPLAVGACGSFRRLSQTLWHL